MPSPGALRAWPRPQWPLYTGAAVRACVKHYARRYESWLKAPALKAEYAVLAPCLHLALRRSAV